MSDTVTTFVVPALVLVVWAGVAFAVVLLVRTVRWRLGRGEGRFDRLPGSEGRRRQR